jgi:glycosyltransferase involved in cell wall biosynthesis
VGIYAITRTGLVKEEAKASPKLMIATDASEAVRIPESVRLAADLISTQEPDIFQAAPAGGANGVIVWAEGDELLEGTSEDLRSAFVRGETGRAYVPVHFPCLAEADLIALQPRLNRVGAGNETVFLRVRIAGSRKPSEFVAAALKQNTEPWTRLQLALSREQQPGGVIAELSRLTESRTLPGLLAPLALRNLAVALLRNGDFAEAEKVLASGVRADPGYGDLHYLLGVLWLLRQEPMKAFAALQRATETDSLEHVGSGGETSYRASWLLGKIHGEMGEEKRAAAALLAGVAHRPAFAPSVAALLRQRFSRFAAAQLGSELCQMVRREPAYLEPVFDFFLRHRVFDAPSRLLRTLPLSKEFREILRGRLSSAERRVRPPARQPCEKPGVLFEGSFLRVSGHGRINRALACSLLDIANLDVALEPSESGTSISRLLAERELIAEGFRRNPERIDLTIRHFWPPDFRAPTAGRLACMLPWEHRAVPRAWVREIEKWVDELWVPSRFVANSFTEAGVRASVVQMIPHGYAPEIFCPEGLSWRPAGCRRCAFLFVGGAIRRKGVDILLRAYADAFSSQDDVSLIFKENGASSFYQHNNLVAEVLKLKDDRNAPDVIFLTEEMDDPALASLYRGCEALVLPYRGEGFGMPLLEAMACGKPVVTTAAGPALDFCSAETAYLIPAEETLVPDPLPPFGELTSSWTWFEPDPSCLATALRSIYENQREAQQRGALAAESVAQKYTWTQVTRLYLDRISHLTGQQRSSRDRPLAAELA